MTPTAHSLALDLLGKARTRQLYEQALIKAKGEDFNLFNILRVGHLEVKTHSPLLAELLNREGTHGQGTAFLRLFIKILKLESFEFDPESARVFENHYIGPRTVESGGVIDILIRDTQGRKIVIENKIYAEEQENQLGRYRRYAPNSPLIFLTLNGDDPEETDPKSIPNLRCVSYCTDILNWLQECRKEAANFPCLRESLTQYIHLIKELTQQNTSALMNQEMIKDVLKDKESFRAYLALRNADRAIRAEIVASLNGTMQVLASELGLELESRFNGTGVKYDDCSLSNTMFRGQNLNICFSFDKHEYRELYFGFKFVDSRLPSAISEQIRKEFETEFGKCESNEVWAAHCLWDQHRNWDDDTFASIQFGTFGDDLKQMLERLINVANAACAAL